MNGNIFSDLDAAGVMAPRLSGPDRLAFMDQFDTGLHEAHGYVAPFHGVGGAVLKPWFGPWERNRQLCKNCIRALTKKCVGGAEVEISMLFVDIRGSTGLGERLGPAAFAAVLTAFYRLAAKAIVETDGIVDKYVGDQAIGLYVPSDAGQDHARKAIDGGRRLLEATARADASASGPIPSAAASTPEWPTSGRWARARRSRTSPHSETR